MANSHALTYLETITRKYAVKLKVLISTDVECNFCQKYRNIHWIQVVCLWKLFIDIHYEADKCTCLILFSYHFVPPFKKNGPVG